MAPKIHPAIRPHLSFGMKRDVAGEIRTLPEIHERIATLRQLLHKRGLVPDQIRTNRSAQIVQRYEAFRFAKRRSIYQEVGRWRDKLRDPLRQWRLKKLKR